MGKVDAGRYFLGSHGHYTEVSHRVFTLCLIHGYIAWLGFVVFVLIRLILQRHKRDESLVA